MPSRVTAIVVNWNGIEDTRRCVSSLLNSDYDSLRILVVDNGSECDEAGDLQAAFPEVEVHRIADNRGYAAAANAGARIARAQRSELALLLNNDTTLAPDAISQLERSWGALGTRTIIAPLIVRPDGRVWSAGGSLNWPWVAGQHIGIGENPGHAVAPRRVDWVSGCALLCPIQAFDDVGEFDERYFLYLEDVDWCLRARRRGYTVWCASNARVIHEVSSTVNVIDPRITRYYAYRNFYLTGLRHAPMPWRVWLMGHFVVALAKVLTRNALFPRYRNDSFYNARTRALFDFLRGRTGKAPYAHEIVQVQQRSPSETAV